LRYKKRAEKRSVSDYVPRRAKNWPKEETCLDVIFLSQKSFGHRSANGSTKPFAGLSRHILGVEPSICTQHLSHHVAPMADAQTLYYGFFSDPGRPANQAEAGAGHAH
jgi:hypothetical protein